MLRTLIADITLLPEPDHDKVAIGIRWHTGATDKLRVTRAIHPGTTKRSPSPAVEIITQLGPTIPTAELADILNATGHRTGLRRPFDVKAVQWIHHTYHIPAPTAYTKNKISITDAARRLGCSIGVIYYWIKAGQLDARRSSDHRLCIPWTDAIEATCRTRIATSEHLNAVARRTKPRSRR